MFLPVAGVEDLSAAKGKQYLIKDVECSRENSASLDSNTLTHPIVFTQPIGSESPTPPAPRPARNAD